MTRFTATTTAIATLIASGVMPGLSLAQTLDLGQIPDLSCEEGQVAVMPLGETEPLCVAEADIGDATPLDELRAQAEEAAKEQMVEEVEAEATAEAEASTDEEVKVLETGEEASTDTAPEAETETSTEVETTTETDATVEVETTTEMETPTEETATVEGATTATETTTVTTETVDTGEAATPQAGAEAETDTEVTVMEGGEEADNETAAKVAEVPQEDTEESVERANAQAEVAAGTTEAEGDAEITTEVVTEDSARSSSEEFEATAAVADDDDGLSNLEKFALGALGVVAIGTILNDNDEVVETARDRVVIRQSDGTLRVLKNDDVILRRPGAEVETRTFNDGSTQTTILRKNGVKVVTIRAADGRVLRRERILTDGTRVVLFDDTQEFEPVIVAELPTQSSVPLGGSLETYDERQLRLELEAQAARLELDRRYSLAQVRDIRALREAIPVIELSAINFATNSAAIRGGEVQDLAVIGRTLVDMIDDNPGEVFLIEGHTDAVGSASYNLALSDRRAESAALALNEFFDVPPENMIVQGYGESALRVPTFQAERANRRVTVRRITPLLQER